MYTICNIAGNNYSVLLSVTFPACACYLQHCSQQFQRVSTICNIARNNSSMCQLSATLQATIQSVPAISITLCATILLCIRHICKICAQQLQRVSTICNFARNNSSVCQLPMTLRATIPVYVLSATFPACVRYL